MKTYLLYGILYLMMWTGCKTQTPSQTREYADGLAVFTCYGKYGYIDSTGKEVIPAEYDIVKNFSHGRAYVCKNGKWGYIDKQGKEIIPIKYDYIYGYVWDYGIPYAIVEQNGKRGYISESGQIVLPIEYDDLHDGIDNFQYDIIRKGNKIGILNNRYQEIIPCSFDEIEPFSEDYCMVKVVGRCGYMDCNGNLTIPIRYHEASTFYNGTAAVSQNGVSYLIDKEGRRISGRYDSIVPILPYYRVKKHDHYGIIDHRGHELKPCIYRDEYIEI